MNEKLRQIAIDAKVEHCVSHVRLQEFAELIVKECIAICVSNALDDLDAENPRGASGKCAFDIKEHFGVEE